MRHQASPKASSRAVCSQNTGGSSQCNQARQRKGVQVREEATLSWLTDGNPEGSIKRLLEGVARCKINIQKSIVPATYNQEVTFFFKKTRYMYTLLYLKWVINKDLLYSTGNSAPCYVAAWMGEEFGGQWIHKYGWVPLLCTWNYHNIVNQLYSNTK